MIRNRQNAHLINTFGLVVCGGQSIRMGADKSRITYYSKPQLYHVYDLLSSFCEKVFICCNRNQAGAVDRYYNLIEDLPEYAGTGPMAALLSAFKTFPCQNFLVAGCDYPLLSATELKNFTQNIERKFVASAFYNYADKYEPLLAFYTQECAPLLFDSYQQNQHSLEYFLRSNAAQKYIPEDDKCLKSIDTPDEMLQILAYLEKKN